MADDMNLGAVCAGGLTALGAVLDFLCSPEEKERYRLWLETKLLTFRNVTRRTFGREEMTFAIALLEKVFGKRFWSGRRWISVSLVVLMALATGVLISLRLARFSQQQTEGNASDYLLPVSFLLIAMASSALSISLSIWLSRFALRFRAGTSLVGVLCLLTVHIFLFAIWKPFSEIAQLLLAWLIGYSLSYRIFEGGDPLAPLQAILEAFWWYLSGMAREVCEQGRLYQVLVRQARFWPSESATSLPELFSQASLFASQLVFLFAASLRLLLSVWFAIAIIYLRGVRPLIISAWSAFIQPEKAFFSIPLSTLAALIVFFSNFSRIYGAVARVFA